MAPKSKAKATPVKKGKGAKRGAKTMEVEVPSTLLEQAHAQTPRPTPKKARDDKAIINKIMADNFKSLSNHAKYIRKVGGLTLEERVTNDRKKWDDGEIVMGANYYKARRAEYEDEDSPSKKLVADKSLPEDEDLFEALCEFRQHNSNPAALEAWLELEELPNQRNAVALMKAILQVDPFSGNKVEVLMLVLKWCSAVAFAQHYPQIWQLVVQVFVRTLEKSWMNMKTKGVKAQTWWKTVRGIAGNVVPVDSWDICVAATGDWSAKKDHLEKVMDSSVGQRIFSACWKQLVGNEISILIDRNIEDFKAKNNHITMAKIAKAKRDLHKSLVEKGKSLHAATKPRPATLQYMSEVFPVMVTSYVEEWNLKMWAFLKTKLLIDKVLVHIFCEADLVSVPANFWQGTIAEDIAEPIKTAREHAVTFVEDPDKATASEIKNALTKNHKLLASFDRYWKIELNFWVSLCGHTGWKRIKDKVLDAIPNADKLLAPAAAHGLIKNIVESKLFTFVGPAMQSNVTSVAEWVSSIKDGRAPKFPVITGNEFLAEVVTRPAFFCTEAGATEGETLVGKAALMAKLEKLKAKGATEVSLPDAQPLGTFNWLLDAAADADAKKLVTEVLKSVPDGPGAPPGGAASSGSASACGAVSSLGGSTASAPKRGAKRKANDGAAMRAATKALFA